MLTTPELQPHVAFIQECLKDPKVKKAFDELNSQSKGGVIKSLFQKKKEDPSMKWRHVALRKWLDSKDAVQVNYYSRVLNSVEAYYLNGKYRFIRSYLTELALDSAVQNLTYVKVNKLSLIQVPQSVKDA